ncbi:MAG TPA: response regulator [Ktedonobacteraceae bacterium]|nr:response regulator [Ktedonobacteraceae bacterium]
MKDYSPSIESDSRSKVHSDQENNTAEKTILIVDDDHDIGEILQQMIMDQTSYRTLWIAEADLALDAAPLLHPSLIILDYMLPTMLGLDLYDKLQRLDNMKGVPVLLISGYTNLPFAELRARGIHVLQKPFEMNEFLDLLAELQVP